MLIPKLCSMKKLRKIVNNLTKQVLTLYSMGILCILETLGVIYQQKTPNLVLRGKNANAGVFFDRQGVKI